MTLDDSKLEKVPEEKLMELVQSVAQETVPKIFSCAQIQAITQSDSLADTASLIIADKEHKAKKETNGPAIKALQQSRVGSLLLMKVIDGVLAATKELPLATTPSEDEIQKATILFAAESLVERLQAIAEAS